MARVHPAPPPCRRRPDDPTCLALLPPAGGATLLTHDLFTNDVLYLDIALDMRPLPRDLLPLVPLFCRCARRPRALGRLPAAGCRLLAAAGA